MGLRGAGVEVLHGHGLVRRERPQVRLTDKQQQATCMYVYAYVCMYVCMYVCVCMYVYVCVCMYVYVCIT